MSRGIGIIGVMLLILFAVSFACTAYADTEPASYSPATAAELIIVTGCTSCGGTSSLQDYTCLSTDPCYTLMPASGAGVCYILSPASNSIVGVGWGSWPTGYAICYHNNGQPGGYATGMVAQVISKAAYGCPNGGTPVGNQCATCPSATPAYTFNLTSGMCERPAQKPKKVVVLDPGHGLTCPSIGEDVGTIGLTDFPASDPPPGRLREDELTVAIALEAERLLSKKYTVVLTKRDANSCVSKRKRGQIANDKKANVFVSIHINAPNTILGIVNNPYGNGTSVLYNSSKPAAKGLADQMSLTVSSNLGTNNRGSKVDDIIAVLKPTVTKMTAVLVEVARVSGDDEQILHAPVSITRAALGIQSAVEAYVGN